MTGPRLADVCTLACARLFEGDGEILASPMAAIARLGAQFAQATTEPLLVLSEDAQLPYRRVFDVVWMGRRHVMMGASQIDRFGNQNISAIGDYAAPKVMLLGVRGAPGNTINHPTSYWVPKHNKRVFVPEVSVVSGIGADKARKLGHSARYFDLRGVVSNLAVLDFATDDGAMRLRSTHPGVSVQQVIDATGFELVIPTDVPTTESPNDDAMAVLNQLDPEGRRYRWLPDPE